MSMNYREAIAYLDGFVNYERGMPGAKERGAFDLSRIRELAARLGDPQRRFPALHVAGTKGKGSVCAFAHAILSAAGLRVARYTSPHLLDVRERIQVGESWIPEAVFARLLERCRPVLEEMRRRPAGTRRPTYFEVLTHLAFLHFAQCEVDVAVVEVGMGGRLDATNIVEPAACGITSLSLDHTAILGETLPRIAREKAGIFKPGVPAVSVPQRPEAAAALRAAARSVRAQLAFIGRELKLEAAPQRPAPDDDAPPHLQARLRVEGEAWSARATLGLLGRYQAENWALAVRLAQLFYRQRFGSDLPAQAIAEGSQSVVWPGRLEAVPRALGQPRLFLDGAHNPYSLATVLGELKELLPGARPPVALFGCASDKDLPSMLEMLARQAGAVVFTRAPHPRACPPEQLARRWPSGAGCRAHVQADPEQALSLASKLAGPEGTVLAAGSLYLVGALKKQVSGLRGF